MHRPNEYFIVSLRESPIVLTWERWFVDVRNKDGPRLEPFRPLLDRVSDVDPFSLRWRSVMTRDPR